MLAAILLAAGGSRRFGRTNKLLAPLGGRALIAHSLDTLLALPAQRLIVVTGHDRARIERLVGRGRDRRLLIVHNPWWQRGLATSITRGLSALRPVDRRILVLLGDTPALRPQATRAVLRALAAGADAARPSFNGRPGHPAGFRTSALLCARPSEDRGLWGALKATGSARLVAVAGQADDRLDIDTPGALAAARRSGTLKRLPRLSATGVGRRVWSR